LTDTSIVNVALPTIGHDFHTVLTAVASVSIAFSVSLAVFQAHIECGRLRLLPQD
jgi:hypothetical protein